MALLALLLLVPLAAGAGFAVGTGMDPAQAWNGNEGSSGAPAVDGAGVDPAKLVDARRATGEAQSQAGFLEQGSKQLADGTQKLSDSAGDLDGGIDQLVAGSQELSDGMVKLQAGTGQLGAGATELANGVGAAVDQVTGLGVVQGQILQAIDGTLKDIEADKSPQADNMRNQLRDLRGQVEAFTLGPELSDQLKRAKDGSRDLANQLNQPGYGYHDGIYSATDGAKKLNSSLVEAQTKLDGAMDGVNQLDQGADKVYGMAQQNKKKIDGIQRTLPAVQARPNEAAGAGEQQRLLSPVVAMLIAALVMVVGACAGWPLPATRKRDFVLLAIGALAAIALGEVLLLVLATGLSAASAGLAAVVFAVAALASSGLSRVARALAGDIGGAVLAGVAGLAQVGIVGWVWRTAASADVSGIWQTTANLLPLNWATSALTVAGNDGQPTVLYAGLAVLAGLAAIALLGPGLVGQRPARTAAN